MNYTDPVRSENSTEPWGFMTKPIQNGFFIGIASIVIFVIIFGNLLVVVAVIRDTRLRRQIQNWFIVSLAMADLLVGLLVMPISLTFEVLEKWVLGSIMCDLWLALDVLFVTASILNLCLISLDRYWSIANALEYLNKRTQWKALAMIGFVWTMALVISFPPLVGWKAELEPGQCSLSTDTGYVLYSAMGSFFIPVTVLVFVYMKIFQITRSRNRARRRAAKKTQEAMMHSRSFQPGISNFTEDQETTKMSLSPQPPLKFSLGSQLPLKKISSIATFRPMLRRPKRTGAVVSYLSPGIDGECETQFEMSNIGDSEKSPMTEDDMFLRKQRKLRRQDRRSTFILGTVLSSFILCWLPFFILYILGPTGIHIPTQVFDVIFWLGYCNSALNPIIYTVMNRDFKRAFKRLLTCTS